MSPRTRRDTIASRKPCLCVICGKAGVPTSSDAYHAVVFTLESRQTVLAFLESHEVLESDSCSDTSMACNACTTLVKKTDRLQVAYEKSLTTLKRKHARFKAKQTDDDVYDEPVELNGTGDESGNATAVPESGRELRSSSVELKVETSAVALPVVCEVKEEPSEIADDADGGYTSSSAKRDDGFDQAADEAAFSSDSENERDKDDEDDDSDYRMEEDSMDSIDAAAPRRKCPHCPEEFPVGTKSEKKAYYDHLRKERQKDPSRKSKKFYDCDQCDFKSKKRDALIAHFEKDHPDVPPFPCDKCQLRFQARDLLRSHKSSDHSRLVCDCCGKKFSSTGALHMHKGLYDYSGMCDICGKFSPNIKQHKLKMHKNTLPTPCRFCGMMCRNVRHRRVHECESHGKGKSPNVKKRWTCTAEGCEVWFTEKHSLARHMSQAHGTKLENAESFTCEHCGKEFFNPKSYREHINGHLGLKPHVCPICSYATNISSNLHLHLKQVHRMTLSVARQNMAKGSLPSIPPPPLSLPMDSQPVNNMAPVNPLLDPQMMSAVNTGLSIVNISTADLAPVVLPSMSIPQPNDGISSISVSLSLPVALHTDTTGITIEATPMQTS